MYRAKKFSRLKEIIKSYQSCLIAFSAGADSTFLLKSVALVLPKDNILAVTAVSQTYPEKELKEARALAKSIGVRHKIIKTGELKDKRFSANSQRRCYFCKNALFSQLQKLARQEKLKFVLDASNISDKSDFRPGSAVLKKLKIKSPLQEAGLAKEDVRVLSKQLKLPTWNKPSSACLASRIPYNTHLTASLLGRIDKAEDYLKKFLRSGQLRLRHHGDLCRIEVSENNFFDFLAQRKAIVDGLKKLGYNYITLDLEGYRMGSFNQRIKNK